MLYPPSQSGSHRRGDTHRIGNEVLVDLNPVTFFEIIRGIFEGPARIEVAVRTAWFIGFKTIVRE